MGPLDPPASLRHKTGYITQYRQITKVYSTILLCKRITHFISAQLVDYHILGLLNEIFPLPLTHHHFPICIPILHNSEMYSNSNSVGANHDHQMTRWLQDRLFLLLAQKEWKQTFKASTHKIKYVFSFFLKQNTRLARVCFTSPKRFTTFQPMSMNATQNY